MQSALQTLQPVELLESLTFVLFGPGQQAFQILAQPDVGIVRIIGHHNVPKRIDQIDFIFLG
jgi:hypothetical protein